VSADTERGLSPMQLAYTIWSFVVGYSFGPSLGELHTAHRLAVFRHYAPLAVPVGGALVALLVFGLWVLIRRQRRLALIVCLWFLCPIGFVIVGTLLTTHPFNVRYAAIAFFPVILVLVIGLAALPALLSGIGWAALLVVSVVSLRGYYDDPRYARDDNRGAAHFFAAHGRPQDLVLAHRAFTDRILRFYLPPGMGRIVPFPEGDRPLASFDVDSALTAAVGDAPRFWFFLSRATPEEMEPLIAYCDHVYHRDTADSYQSAGVTLLACDRDAGRSATPQPPARPAPAAGPVRRP